MRIDIITLTITIPAIYCVPYCIFLLHSTLYISPLIRLHNVLHKKSNI